MAANFQGTRNHPGSQKGFLWGATGAVAWETSKEFPKERHWVGLETDRLEKGDLNRDFTHLGEI